MSVVTSSVCRLAVCDTYTNLIVCAYTVAIRFFGEVKINCEFVFTGWKTVKCSIIIIYSWLKQKLNSYAAYSAV